MEPEFLRGERKRPRTTQKHTPLPTTKEAYWPVLHRITFGVRPCPDADE
jgi:hypothetical protein